MENNKKYGYTIVILVFILSLAFYWFEWRPTQLIKACAEEAELYERIHKLPSGIHPGDAYDYFYNLCLNREGVR